MVRLLTLALALLVITAAPAAAAPPVNDLRASATDLPLTGQYFIGSTIDATGETAEPIPNVNGVAPRCDTQASAADCVRTVWYAIQPAAGPVNVATCQYGTEF